MPVLKCRIVLLNTTYFVLNRLDYNMHSTPELDEYRKFLAWFEVNHPLLNRDYWQHITIPKPGEGVKVMSTSLEPAILLQLEQIEFDYYHPGRTARL